MSKLLEESRTYKLRSANLDSQLVEEGDMFDISSTHMDDRTNSRGGNGWFHECCCPSDKRAGILHFGKPWARSVFNVSA